MPRILKKTLNIDKSIQIKYDSKSFILTLINDSKSINHSIDIPKSIDLSYDSLNHVINFNYNKYNSDLAIYTTYFIIIKNLSNFILNSFQSQIKLVGVGFKVAIKENLLLLNVGLSHRIIIKIPKTISVTSKEDLSITVSGYDKNKVKSFAMYVRSFKKPEPYNLKGIFVDNESIVKKIGKK
jgi:large subunit ribosomal protein L6